ncbi:hypothetical protein [Nocardiopsis synnemataformans]|uniref:hypothetical protein n=1 Tax=Nocardiopsis synnemataformans TaxID=61305 RepID=UPI003EB8C4D7
MGDLNAITARATAAAADPLVVIDHEGDLEIWHANDLLPDGSGDTDEWRRPAVYRPEACVARTQLDTWERGEDPQEDALRDAFHGLVQAVQDRADLLGLVRDLRQELRQLRSDGAGTEPE